MPSDAVKQTVGVYVEDAPPAGPAFAWLSRECRRGSFRPLVESFCRAQSETVDPDRVVIEQVTPVEFVGRIPYVCRDHESIRPFVHEVRFAIDPVRRSVRSLPS